MSADDPRDEFVRYLADLLAREYRSATAEDVPAAADLERSTAALLGAADTVQIEPGPPPDPDVRPRAVIVSSAKHGFHATSYKLSNLQINRVKILALAAESAYFGGHLAGHAHPVLFGLGVLLLIRCAVESIALELTSDYASVCWGLIRAQGDKDSASLENIESVCNEGRRAHGLDALSHSVVLASLRALGDAGIAAPSADSESAWRMTELSRILP
jgi:hypothetical protein